MASIGVPDVSQLPLQSAPNQYDLRNANAAFDPQAAPPPLGPMEQPAPSAFQMPPEAFQQAPQFSQPSGFDQLQVQPLHVAASALADQVKQQNMQQGQGVMKHLMTSFLGGMGRAMMVHSGLPTPEQEQDQRLMKIAALTNAQSELDLRNAQTAKYRMDVQPATLLDPRTGTPVPGPDGRPITGPQWQIERMQQGLVEKMNQRPQNLTPSEQITADYRNQLIQEGKTPAEIQQAFAKPPAAGDDFAQAYQQYLKESRQPDSSALRLRFHAQWAASGQTPERQPKQLAVGPDGQVMEVRPGMTIPEGTQSLTQFGKQDELTSSTKSMVEAAPKVLSFINRLGPQIDKVAGELGPVEGRWSEFWAGKVGADNPDYVKLRTNMGLLTTLLMRMHVGARGGEYIMKHFQDLLDQGKMSPGNMKAALGEIKQYAQETANEGQPRSRGGGKTAPPAAHDPLGIL